MKRAFLTTTRDDLLAICRIMARAVDPEFLFDADNPVSVYVNGTTGSGKKMVSDVFYEEILRNETSRSGAAGYDEYVTGKVNFKPVDINYVDLFWHSSFYSQKGLHLGQSGTHQETNTSRQSAFAAERVNGGIDIYQNALDPQNPGVEIWMEKYAETSHLPYRSPDSKLRKAFEKAASGAHAQWSRYVEIEVTDPRLLESSRFMRSLDKLSSRIGKFDTFGEDAKTNATVQKQALKSKGFPKSGPS